MTTAIIIIDHGSRNAQSNELLDRIARQFFEAFCERYPIVEPAHMELAEPSIATAFARCVARGADRVIACPFFLGPGKHWSVDIPQLLANAAQPYPYVDYLLAAPLGSDELMLKLIEKRVEEAIESASVGELQRI
jgi:sirohydrochlorin ferrochelatase